MTLSRYVHTGAAPATGLASGISSSATSFTVLSGTGYPTGSVGDFVICLDPGTSSEEKVLCSTRSGVTFTVASGGRGYDGTTAASHSAGTTNVTHVLSAAEVDDTSAHIYDTTRNDHTQYVEGTATPGGDLAGSGSTYTTPVLKTSGVTAGTYNSVTVNAKGLVTAGTTTASILLAVVSYNPATQGGGSNSSTSIWAAADSTNLTISFTAPTSGKVLARLTGYGAGVSSFGSWGLLTHGTTTSLVSGYINSTVNTDYAVSKAFLVTGLTSGNSYQYDWGLLAASVICESGNNYGPATMEIWSA